MKGLYLYLSVSVTRTRVPTATPEDDRGEKAEPRRYALLTLIRHLETHVHDGRLKLRRAGTRCFHAERRQQPTNAGTVATDCYTVAVEVGP